MTSERNTFGGYPGRETEDLASGTQRYYLICGCRRYVVVDWNTYKRQTALRIECGMRVREQESRAPVIGRLPPMMKYPCSLIAAWRCQTGTLLTGMRLLPNPWSKP